MRAMLAPAAVLAMLGGAGFAHAKLKVGEVVPCHGTLGPARKSSAFVPGDVLFARFVVAGVEADDEGNSDLLVSWSATGADGEALAEGSAPARGALGLAGDEYLGRAAVVVKPGTAPGDYALTVTAKDNESGETASGVYKFTVVEERFAAAFVRLAADPSGKTPAPAVGFVGQGVYVLLGAVGFDPDEDKVDVAMEAAVFDSAGRPLRAKPYADKFVSRDKKANAKLESVPFSYGIPFSRPGTFTLKITVTDRVSKATDTFECQLTVLPLPK